jgi:hypothetical protein
MRTVFVPAALAVLALGCGMAVSVHAQAPSPVSIPLGLVTPNGTNNPYQLGIYVTDGFRMTW